MNQQVIIIGAGGHARVIADIICANGDKVVGFLDDDKKKNTLGIISDWHAFKDHVFIIGIGDNGIREKISRDLLGVNWYTAIHPSAVISPKAIVDTGTVVMPNAVINSGASVGKHCIINSGAIVEHDDIIEDFCHISVGAKLGGTVRIGSKTWVGAGAVVCNNLSVCENCMIGAGAVVIRQITEQGTYIGVPASLLRK